MLTVRKRGKTFDADLLLGETRVRGSPGTRDQDAARRMGHRLETAISEGRTSKLWGELTASLPRTTFTRFAVLVGVKEQRLPTWSGLLESFEMHLAQRIQLGKLRNSTAERYRFTLREFQSFLEERKITLLEDINKPLVESFKVWRTQRINTRKY